MFGNFIMCEVNPYKGTNVEAENMQSLAATDENSIADGVVAVFSQCCLSEYA